jgi:hypothetical protein
MQAVGFWFVVLVAAAFAVRHVVQWWKRRCEKKLNLALSLERLRGERGLAERVKVVVAPQPFNQSRFLAYLRSSGINLSLFAAVSDGKDLRLSTWLGAGRRTLYERLLAAWTESEALRANVIGARDLHFERFEREVVIDIWLLSPETSDEEESKCYRVAVTFSKQPEWEPLSLFADEQGPAIEDVWLRDVEYTIEEVPASEAPWNAARKALARDAAAGDLIPSG